MCISVLACCCCALDKLLHHAALWLCQFGNRNRTCPLLNYLPQKSQQWFCIIRFVHTCAKADDTQSRFRCRKSAPISRTRCDLVHKKSALKIGMDNAKIDESISSMPVMVISSRTSYIKTFLSITGRRHGHVHTRNWHKIEQATDQRQNLVPEKSGTRSVWHTVQKSAPKVSTEIWTVCHRLNSESNNGGWFLGEHSPPNIRSSLWW